MVHNVPERDRNPDEDYHFDHSEQFRLLYDYDPLSCLLPKLAEAGKYLRASSLSPTVLLRSIHMQISRIALEYYVTIGIRRSFA